MSKTNLLFFQMTKANSLVNEISSHYRDKEDFEVNFSEDEKQANRSFSHSPKGIFFFKVNSKEDLKAAIKILRSQKKEIQKGLIKPTCILARSNKKIEQILSKYQCKEILPADIQPRSAVFKIDFWAKQIRLQAKKYAPEAEKETKTENKVVSEKAKIVQKSNIISLNALKHESDIWLIKQKTDTKKVLRRWLLRVVGPSPQVCKWEEVKDGPNNSQKTWRLNFLPDDNEFYSSEGNWFFEGAKPEFDWKMKRWNFSSESPHLYFQSEGSGVISRFKLKETNIEVCENSKIAQAKEELIIKTFDTNYSFEKSKEIKEETTVDSEDHENPGYLEGEVHDNSRLSSHLRGDNKEAEVEKNDKKGSFKEGDKGGHLKGDVHDKKGVENKKDEKSLDDKDDKVESSTDKNKKTTTEDLGGHLEGQVKNNAEKLKNERDKKEIETKEELERKAKKKAILDELLNKEKDVEAIDYSPKAQIERKKHEAIEKERAQKAKSQLESEEKNNREKNNNLFKDKERSKPDFSNSDITEKEKKERERGEFSESNSGNLGGKNSTDQVDKSPLAAKIKKAEEIEKQKRDKGDFSETQPAALGGKSSTDQIDGSPLGSKIKKDEQANKEDTERGSFDAESLNDMGGKSSTDQIDRSPLGSKTQKQADIDKRNKDKSKYKEDSQNNPRGKSSTDQIDRSPLGSRTQKEIQKEKQSRRNNFKEGSHNNLDGKGSTDELDRSHYNNKKSIDHRKEKKEREDLVAANQRGDSSQDTTGHSASDAKEKEVNKEKVGYGSIRTPGDNKLEHFGSDKKSTFEEALDPKLDYEEGIETAEESNKKPEISELESLLAKPSEVSTESGRLNVSIEQSTAAGNAIIFLCDFDDFYPEELSVQAPKNSLTVGEVVSAKVSLKYNSSRKEVVVKGKIIEVESFDDRLDHLVIQIERINKSDYEQFISLYNDRQSQIMDFLEKAKGF